MPLNINQIIITTSIHNLTKFPKLIINPNTQSQILHKLKSTKKYCQYPFPKMPAREKPPNKMDEFQYPIDWIQVDRYKRSTLIGKERELIVKEAYSTGLEFCQAPYCSKNGRIVSRVPGHTCCQSQGKLSNRYGIYGPNCVIYLGLLNRLTLFMVFSACTVACALLALNSSNNQCTKYTKCLSQLFTYKISIFNILNRPVELKAQVIIWLIISVILCIFFIHLRIYTVKTYKKINNENVTEADYGIILRRIPLSFNSEQKIREVVNKIKQEILKKQEEKQIQTDRLSQVEINYIMNVQYIVMLCKMDQVMDKLHKEVVRFKRAIKEKRYQQFQRKFDIDKDKLTFSGTAIVVFSSIRANDIIHSIVNYSVRDTILSYFFPFIYPHTQFKMKNRHISIHRAPEPRDLLWTNLGYSQKNRIRRKILFAFLTTMTVGVSAVVLYYLAKAQIEINNIVLTISMVAIVFIFNFIIQILLNHMLKLQKIDTMTNLNAQNVYLNVLYQSVNLGFFNLVIPFLVKLPNIEQALKAADFPNYMIITMLFAFLSINLGFVFHYFEIISRISKLLTKKEIIIKTQHEANQDFKLPKLQMAQKYSNFVQLFWFGLVFGILSPVCTIIGAICFFLYFIYQRILFNSKYSIPEYTRIRTSTSFINALQPVVILIGLVNLGLHQLISLYDDDPVDPDILAICIANIVIGVILVVVPWNYLLEKVNYNIYSNQEEMLYKDKKGEFQITYNDANPATSMDFGVVVAEKIKEKNNPELMFKILRKPETQRQILQQFKIENELR